jgi:predicted DNA-binding transcriptional regulator YafY
LKNDEIAAFFLSSIREPLEDLGLSGQLRAARLELAAALPESRRALSSRLAQRIVIDTHPRTKRARPTGFLPVLHQAAMEDRWVRAVFVRRFDVTTRRRIAPYGLVARAGTWYLVWAGEDGHVRVDAVSNLHRATPEADGFERPSDFDLDSFWRTWREEEEAARPPFRVRLRVRKDALPYVRDALGERHGVFPARRGSPRSGSRSARPLRSSKRPGARSSPSAERSRSSARRPFAPQWPTSHSRSRGAIETGDPATSRNATSGGPV